MMKFAVFLAAALLANGNAQAAGNNYCGELRGRHYGPYDYRKPSEFNLPIVENAHFTSEVEAGLRGNTGYLGDDLNYTLTAVPNHARALSTVSRLALRQKSVKIAYMKYPVECYFDRAIRFAPDDGTVRALYANYLQALGRVDEALKLFDSALELSPEDATIHYNAGLLYLKRHDYEKAREHARKAYDKEFPLPGLKNKLVEAGQWEVPAK